ncbi:peptide ABC transporter substrate-binding protein [Ktedonosporobacter rubrisoli]|uniref:Peptide ABC transporter substrate-binding protein n=1 Tax=Ktedonosporobacter rubrisoli TaxID=2509675 RepID=A0A4P6JNT7_KTERU|nr:peptide ABC transporter substrate-binding protein [Ktedonosporobacter rubrisoli]QBD76988.1 peptide ABC transporter substrate-binding protein [Ktedonosporobacter rubrisoli]
MPDRLFVRKLPPILLCLFALLLVGCGATSPGPNNSNLTPAPADKQVLRYPIGAADFGTLDPARAMLDIDNFTIQMIFTGLVELKSDGTLIDQMAASHQISADGLTYTFKLKPNLKFSDGSPITAEDIAYSINRVLSPETKSPTSSLLEPIKDSDKILAGKIPTLIGDSLLVKDLQTISIALSSPAAYFLQALSGPEAFTVNKRLIEKYGSKWTDHLAEGAGSGPFQAQAYDHNTGLTLVPNPNYSGPQSKLQKIEMLRSGDVDTTYKTYQTGQLDYTTVPTIQLASAKQRKDFHQVPILQMTAITMNFLAKPFNNVKIRQAFALAVNKDLLAENVMHGATAPTNHILPLGMPGYNKAFTGVAGVSSTRGDASKAKQLLQEGMQEEGYASVNQLPR